MTATTKERKCTTIISYLPELLYLGYDLINLFRQHRSATIRKRLHGNAAFLKSNVILQTNTNSAAGEQSIDKRPTRADICAYNFIFCSLLYNWPADKYKRLEEQPRNKWPPGFTGGHLFLKNVLQESGIVKRNNGGQIEQNNNWLFLNGYRHWYLRCIDKTCWPGRNRLHYTNWY